MIAEHLQELGKVGDTVSVRQIVHAIDGVVLSFFAYLLREILSDVLVGEKHEVFDEKIRCHTFLEMHGYGFAALIKLDLHFWRIKGDGSGLFTADAKLSGKRVQSIQLLKEFTLLFIEHFLRVLVCKALVGVHHCLAVPCFNDIRLVLKCSDGQSVVEVLRRERIDGKGSDASEVLPASCGNALCNL